MLDCGQHGDVDARLRSFEEACLADVLKQTVHVQRILSADSTAKRLDQVIGARGGVGAFSAAPDALIGVDLDEQAVTAANEAAGHVGDLQIRGHR